MASNLGSFIEAGSAAVLNELLAPLRDDNGIAIPSRYEVEFFFPNMKAGVESSSNIFTRILMDKIGSGHDRNVNMQCNKIDFPGRTLDTIEDTGQYGPTRSVVNGFSFSDITATFYCQNDMKEKEIFEAWQKCAYNPQTWGVQWYDSYVGNIKIYNLDQQNDRRYGVELVEAFPKTIVAQQLSSDAAATPQTVDVTFSYRYWKNMGTDFASDRPMLDRIQTVLANQVSRTIINSIPKVLRKLF
jgi:hypothetical protein